MSELDIAKNLVGSAGEYYVCAELCRRGILALVTPKNNQLFDILATDAEGRRAISIQVKTMGTSNAQGWKLSAKMTQRKNNPLLFTVLVDMQPDGTNDFYVYEYDTLVDRINELYLVYLSKLKRDGTARKELGFRWFDHKYFSDDDRRRKNNWDILGF